MAAKVLPAILSVLAVIAGGLVAQGFADFGPLSFHMAMHIAVMNVAAPLVAMLVCAGLPRQRGPHAVRSDKDCLAEAGASRRPYHRLAAVPLPRFAGKDPAERIVAHSVLARFQKRGWLWASVAMQVGLLVAWHMPPVHQLIGSSATASALAGCVLAVFAVVFWTALLVNAEAAPWQSMLALMLNAKVACLLGGILVFAPRDLYATIADHGAHGGLDDQQLAGLLMLAVCPLSYVVAGITIAAQMMARLEREAAPAAMPRREAAVR